MAQVETPYIRLKRRLDSEFSKKRLVGDIVISSEEYGVLIKYLNDIFRSLSCGGVKIVPPDSMITTALVQIGIKHYDGNYWGKVAGKLSLTNVKLPIQTALGVAAWETFKHFNLPKLGRNERVKTILMHGFVSDHYADDLYEFLFHFYRLDLERNLRRLDDELLKELVTVMARTDNTGRTYWLKIQTANAVALNPELSATRVKHMLRLIDQRFWEEKVPRVFGDRLTELFVRWEAVSDAFSTYLGKPSKLGGVEKKGNRFFTPYLHCRFSTSRFYLVFPKQIIPSDYKGSVYWEITIGEKFTRSRELKLYDGVIGNKTEEITVEMDRDSIFDEVSMKLVCQDKSYRSFKIDKDSIRFFDAQGCHIKSEALPTGDVHAFTYYDEVPVSEAYITSERTGELLQTYFEFQDGDILRFTDGRIFKVGKTPGEGIMPRNKIAGAYGLTVGSKQIPLYSKAPVILFKIPATSAEGTLIVVNGKRMRLFDTDTTIIDIHGESEEKGYIINLADFGCGKDGMYEVFIDTPRNNRLRFWEFVIINDFRFKFEDAPYIFVPKGTIHFPRHLSIRSVKGVDKFADENVFRFEISPAEDYITFYVETAIGELVIRVYVPVFKWRFAEGDCWKIEQPGDIWHTDLPNAIYLKHPDDNLSLCIDDGVDEHLQEQSMSFTKNKGKHMFVCDLMRFKSWLNGEKGIRQINLITAEHSAEFFRVITKSLVKSCLLRADHEKKLLFCDLNIIGENEYFADVMYRGKIIATKLQIIDGHFQLPISLTGGEYTVIIFEKESSLTGFGGTYYTLLDEFTQTIINPDDLSGCSFEITQIKHNSSTVSCLNFSCRYLVYDIYRPNEDMDGMYYGKLVALRIYDNKILISKQVKLAVKPGVIPTYVDLKFRDYDYPDNYESFLYDTYRKIIVETEQQGLPRAVRYRRYITLFPDECEYVINFLESGFIF